ncbi:MAG: hypothetical protein KKF46_04130 [Nanoarchaeota archaeon]|nr:hypothetical protein [Nanoarchaeota archaeon]MBU2441284.1 hypothetical protein [Nanoarchaeota archaeon]
MAGIVDNKEVLELSGYLKTMDSRMDNLKHSSDAIANDLEKGNTALSIKKKALARDLESVKNDMSQIKQDVRTLQKVILQLIAQLKSSVKSEELERFNKRIDLWGPENLINRNELDKISNEL